LFGKSKLGHLRQFHGRLRHSLRLQPGLVFCSSLPSSAKRNMHLGSASTRTNPNLSVCPAHYEFPEIPSSPFCSITAVPLLSEFPTQHVVVLLGPPTIGLKHTHFHPASVLLLIPAHPLPSQLLPSSAASVVSLLELPWIPLPNCQPFPAAGFL
jgi:hypothetical protein